MSHLSQHLKSLDLKIEWKGCKLKQMCLDQLNPNKFVNGWSTSQNKNISTGWKSKPDSFKTQIQNPDFQMPAQF